MNYTATRKAKQRKKSTSILRELWPYQQVFSVVGNLSNFQVEWSNFVAEFSKLSMIALLLANYLEILPTSTSQEL
jgi:hypothetical protein